MLSVLHAVYLFFPPSVCASFVRVVENNASASDRFKTSNFYVNFRTVSLVFLLIIKMSNSNSLTCFLYGLE